MSEITGSDPGEVVAQEVYASGEVSGERFRVSHSPLTLTNDDYLSHIRSALVELTRIRKDLRFWVESIEFWARKLEPALVVIRNMEDESDA
jgi:hypothetical protein